MSSFIALRSARIGVTRPLSTSAFLRFPVNPTGSPNADADTAKISRDKQGTGKLDDSQHGGSAQGGPTSGGSGGPTEGAGLADPEVPKDEASQAKKGMTSGQSDSAARN